MHSGHKMRMPGSPYYKYCYYYYYYYYYYCYYYYSLTECRLKVGLCRNAAA